MWVKVSIAALIIALVGGAMYYLDNEAAMEKERKEGEARHKNLTALRTEFTQEKEIYVDFLHKNAALERDIAALKQQCEELTNSNAELAASNEAKQAELTTHQEALAELRSKSSEFETIQQIIDRINILGEEKQEKLVTKDAEQGKLDSLNAQIEQLMANNAALRQLKADQDAHLSPPNLKTRVTQVLRDLDLVVLEGGAADLGIVPASKLAIMRGDEKIAELEVNAVESRVSTATILKATVVPGEQVEVGDLVVSVRP